MARMPRGCVFPDYEFCFSGARRRAEQRLRHSPRDSVRLRAGYHGSLARATTCGAASNCGSFPGRRAKCALLSVHLKSGCARDRARFDPAELRGAGPPGAVARALDRRPAAEHKPFAVLGDFNRDLRQRAGRKARSGRDIDDADPPAADLVNTAEGQTFQNCMPSQTFSGFIDYIVLSRDMARGLVANSFGRALYRPRDAARRKLSDHCPVFIRLRVADATRPAS